MRPLVSAIPSSVLDRTERTVGEANEKLRIDGQLIFKRGAHCISHTINCK